MLPIAINIEQEKRPNINFHEKPEKMIFFMVRQAHHERYLQAHHKRNQQTHAVRIKQAHHEGDQITAARTEPVEGRKQKSLKAFLLAISLLITIVNIAFADDSLTAIELQGRKIYREGSDGSQHEISVTLGHTEDSLPATSFACANCHGLEGEGKQEGGLTVPAITSQLLFGKPYPRTATKQAYDEKTLVQALTKGFNAQGKPLSTSMPKYQITNSQAQALVAYLRHLGSAGDVETGVTTSEVQLATLIPLTGPLANIGKILKSTLEACIAEANTQGLIYGRKMSLVTLDSGNTKEEILAASKRLQTETNAFALVSGFFPEITPDLYKTLAQENLPVIAPLTFVPDNSVTPSAPFFYFLPSYIDQSRALVDFWLTQLAEEKRSAAPKLALVHSDRTSDLNVVSAIRQQLQRHHLAVIAEVIISQATQRPSKNQLTNLQAANPDAIFFIGNPKEFAEFNKTMTKSDRQPLLLGLLGMLGTEGLNIPGLAMNKMLLATPFNLNEPNMPKFAAMLDKHSVKLQSPGLQRIACASVDFVVEGLKRTGKHLTRNTFIQSLEEAKNFPVDILPPPQFDANNRKGTRGAYIMIFDTKTKSLSPQSPWVTATDD